jgi:hypothetical protein
VTNASGAFACAGLSAGAYECSVDEHLQAAGAAKRVVLGEGEAPQLLLSTAASGSIRVTLGTSGSETVRPSKVFARSANTLREAVQEGTDFVFAGMPLGKHEVYADLPSHVSEVVLDRDGQIALLTLQVPSSAAIRGRVLDGKGAPVVDAWVRASPANPFASDPDYARDRPGLTDDAGEFVLQGLAPGSYDLRVESSVGRTHARGVQAGSGSVALRVEGYAGLSGDVLASSGVGVDSFTLSYEKPDGTTESLEARNGHWELTGLQPGPYHLRVTSTDGHASRDVVLPADGQAKVSMTLEPALQELAAER